MAASTDGTSENQLDPTTSPQTESVQPDVIAEGTREGSTDGTTEATIGKSSPDSEISKEIAVNAGNSDTDDYVVELRVPRSKDTHTKKFKLLLKPADSSDDWSESEADYPRSPRRRGSFDIRTLSPSLPPQDAEDEESCTEENWEVFLYYRTQFQKHGPLIISKPNEGFRVVQPSETKALGLTKIPGGQIELAIRSPYLQERLRQVVQLEYCHGVHLSASRTFMTYPFTPLYHFIEEMNESVAKDTEATPADVNHMKALSYFTTLGWPSINFADVRSKISRGLIVYEDLWALFKPGELAVSMDPIGHLQISRISAVKYEQENRVGGEIEYRWCVTLVKITWNAGRFRLVSTRRRIEIFADSKRITDLDFYPLSHYESPTTLKKESIDRGRAWKEYCSGEPRVMSYDGQALPLVAIAPPMNTRYRIPDGDDQRDYNALSLSSTVIVDSGATSKTIAQASIDEKQRLWHPVFHDGGIVHTAEITEFAEEDLMICPASITVFSLDDQDWYSVDVAGLEDKQWRPKTTDRLVLDPATKSILIHLATTNSLQFQANKSRDVIEGKGKGVVLLFHGPPGVGKTLTAEVLSEFTKRPLLKINLGKIASHKKWEPALERIFTNAEDWKAILLIDEAEIVLEKRTFERMTQNSWISVFLRKLEYYKGILILTTNLIDCIDEAFESRISYPVRFRELSRDDRLQIWSDFVKDMKMLPAYKETLMKEVYRWSEAEINGRQIRNVVLMAEHLAASDNTRLTPRHIDDLLNVILEFCDYNQGNSSRVKKIQSMGLSYPQR